MLDENPYDIYVGLANVPSYLLESVTAEWGECYQ